MGPGCGSSTTAVLGECGCLCPEELERFRLGTAWRSRGLRLTGSIFQANFIATDGDERLPLSRRLYGGPFNKLLHGMSERAANFERDGFVVLPSVVRSAELELLERLAADVRRGPGSRRLLERAEGLEVAIRLARDSQLADLLGHDTRPLLCTYLEKAPDSDWSVPLHRDSVVPLRHRLPVHGWSAWTRKEGIDFARPPAELLARLSFVRVHLEPSTLSNSPLYVVPGSHAHEGSGDNAVPCLVPQGSALVLRPTLLHGSAGGGAARRRVFQFMFGPWTEPAPMEWRYAVQQAA